VVTLIASLRPWTHAKHTTNPPISGVWQIPI
jgi:hypothetical protein